jgi:hypothetical protein
LCNRDVPLVAFLLSGYGIVEWSLQFVTLIAAKWG